MHKPGSIILTKLQYADTFEIKQRPAVVLFEEMGNIVVAGITSNKKMKGIPLTKNDGAVKESVIKLNYIFAVSEAMISKVLFRVNKKKRALIFRELGKRLSLLNSD